MFKKFCFCFKHKTATILMAILTLVIGVLGTIFFATRIYCNSKKLEVDYLIFSLVYLLISALLFGAIIWEKPLLIMIYEAIQTSVLVAILMHSIICVPGSFVYWSLLLVIVLMVYWMFCIYMYSTQLQIKNIYVKYTILEDLNTPGNICDVYSNKYAPYPI